MTIVLKVQTTVALLNTCQIAIKSPSTHVRWVCNLSVFPIIIMCEIKINNCNTCTNTISIKLVNCNPGRGHIVCLNADRVNDEIALKDSAMIVNGKSVVNMTRLVKTSVVWNSCAGCTSKMNNGGILC